MFRRKIHIGGFQSPISPHCPLPPHLSIDIGKVSPPASIDSDIKFLCLNRGSIPSHVLWRLCSDCLWSREIEIHRVVFAQIQQKTFQERGKYIKGHWTSQIRFNFEFKTKFVALSVICDSDIVSITLEHYLHSKFALGARPKKRFFLGISEFKGQEGGLSNSQNFLSTKLFLVCQNHS